MAEYDPNIDFEPGKLQLGIAVFTGFAFLVVAAIVLDWLPAASA